MVDSDARRWPVVLTLLFGAVALHAGLMQDFRIGLAFWFLIAVGLGLVVQRWWALILAALPWPLGIGLGLAIGRYAFLGEAWQVAALLSLLVGLGGMVLGVAIARTWSHRQ